jgi:hypothetical protein
VKWMTSEARCAESRLTRRTRVTMLTVFASAPLARSLKSRARSSVVEHLAFNQRVVGSIPTGLTTPISPRVPIV